MEEKGSQELDAILPFYSGLLHFTNWLAALGAYYRLSCCHDTVLVLLAELYSAFLLFYSNTQNVHINGKTFDAYNFVMSEIQAWFLYICLVWQRPTPS